MVTRTQSVNGSAPTRQVNFTNLLECADMLVITTLLRYRERQEDLCEFKACLVNSQV